MSLTVMNATLRLRREVDKLKYWKNFVFSSLLTPKIRRRMQDKVNWDNDSVVASKNDTFLLKTLDGGSSGMFSPLSKALQDLLTKFLTFVLKLDVYNVRIVFVRIIQRYLLKNPGIE